MKTLSLHVIPLWKRFVILTIARDTQTSLVIPKFCRLLHLEVSHVTFTKFGRNKEVKECKCFGIKIFQKPQGNPLCESINKKTWYTEVNITVHRKATVRIKTPGKKWNVSKYFIEWNFKVTTWQQFFTDTENDRIMKGLKDYIPVLVNIHVAETESSLSSQKDFLAKKKL